MSFSEKLRIVFETVTGKASSDVRGFGKDIDDVDKKTDNLEKSHKGRMGSFAGATVAGFGVAQVVAFAGEILDVGIKLEGLRAKAKTVFEDQIGRVKEWASESAGAMGLTEDAAIGAGASIADLLKPMGFTAEAATDQTLKLLDLSAALSAWSAGAYDAAEVSQILTKAMLGEREQLKSLGISITEADVKARLLAKGQKELTGASLAQAKALATQELIFEKSTDAVRAWTDGSMDSLKAANESKASWTEFGQGIKEALLPIPQWAMDADEALRTMATPWGDDPPFLAQLIDLGRQMKLNGTESTQLATDVLSLTEASKLATIEMYALEAGEKAAALAADAIALAAERAKLGLKHLKDEVSGEQAWNDLQLNLLGIDEKLTAASEAFKTGKLDAQEYALTVAGITLDAKASIADYLTGLEDVPPEVVSEILAMFDPNNVPASIAAMQAELDKHTLNIIARPTGDFSGVGPGGTGLDGGAGWDTGARTYNVTINATDISPEAVNKVIREWQRRNGLSKFS